jgi:hypothetical protein
MMRDNDLNADVVSDDAEQAIPAPTEIAPARGGVRKPPPPPHRFTSRDRATIERLARMGMAKNEIAKIINRGFPQVVARHGETVVHSAHGRSAIADLESAGNGHQASGRRPPCWRLRSLATRPALASSPWSQELISQPAFKGFNHASAFLRRPSQPQRGVKTHFNSSRELYCNHL